MNEKSVVSEHYRGEAGSSYFEHYQRDFDHEGYRIDFEYFRPFLKSDDRVLDFGCGNGGMLRHLAAHVAEAEGLEVNPRALEFARAHGQTVHASLDELPSGRVYDAIISNHVLEHVRDVPTTLEALGKHLRPGGKLLLKLPVDDWRARGQRTWSRTDIDHHLHTWTPKLIGNVLYEAGYNVDDIRVVTSAWHPKLFPLLKWGLASLAFRMVAIVKKRRQLFVRGHAPGEDGID